MKGIIWSHTACARCRWERLYVVRVDTTAVRYCEFLTFACWSWKIVIYGFERDIGQVRARPRRNSQFVARWRHSRASSSKASIIDDFLVYRKPAFKNVTLMQLFSIGYTRTHIRTHTHTRTHTHSSHSQAFVVIQRRSHSLRLKHVTRKNQQQFKSPNKTDMHCIANYLTAHLR
jgi:hypothetical protein